MEEINKNDPAYIIENLQPLFKEAREKKLWFCGRYNDIWFSPDELERRHENKQFIWGPDNWRLLDPNIKLKVLEQNIKTAKQAYEHFLEMLETENKEKP